MGSNEKNLLKAVASMVDHETLFSFIFSPAELLNAFNEKFSTTTGKGIDRINGFQFSARSEVDLTIVSRKIISGDFRFSPFLEVLRTKSRDKNPRLIGIPTVRDRIVLHQLNKFLASIYPDRVPKNVASTYVRKLAIDLAQCPLETTWVCSSDIKTFYDSIQQSQLLDILEKRITCASAKKLIGHAIRTPTVPKNTKRSRHKDFASTGVPQGLAISNILASIYMYDVDDAMEQSDVSYYRYVDDVLMYGDKDKVLSAFESLVSQAKSKGLSLHALNSGKTQIEPLANPFSYLGYTFHLPHISVRESTTERFLQSIASKFSDFIHNKKRRLSKFNYLNEERLKEIFLLELNERISGAISQNKRYGWIAYFNQITDLSLLHQLDCAIANMFKRLPEFNHAPPDNLKKLKRAYFAIKFDPQGGYVRNYDLISTNAQMLEFLVERGRIADDESLTDAEIKPRYEKYVRHLLSAMHADEGTVYS